MSANKGTMKLHLLVIVAFALLLAACPDGSATRFPVCKSDEECAAREDDGGKVFCSNLRCVGCRYDTDCPAGGYCDKTQICKTIAPKQVEDPDVSTAEYKTHDDCLKACMDSACTDVCSARFAEPKKKPRGR